VPVSLKTSPLPGTCPHRHIVSLLVLPQWYNHRQRLERTKHRKTSAISDIYFEFNYSYLFFVSTTILFINIWLL